MVLTDLLLLKRACYFWVRAVPHIRTFTQKVFFEGVWGGPLSFFGLFPVCCKLLSSKKAVTVCAWPLLFPWLLAVGTARHIFAEWRIEPKKEWRGFSSSGSTVWIFGDKGCHLQGKSGTARSRTHSLMKIQWTSRQDDLRTNCSPLALAGINQPHFVLSSWGSLHPFLSNIFKTLACLISAWHLLILGAHNFVIGTNHYYPRFINQESKHRKPESHS